MLLHFWVLVFGGGVKPPLSTIDSIGGHQNRNLHLEDQLGHENHQIRLPGMKTIGVIIESPTHPYYSY